MGLAQESEDVAPFSGQFVTRYRLGSASSAQRAAEKLISDDVLEKIGKKLHIADRFFRGWILKRLKA